VELYLSWVGLIAFCLKKAALEIALLFAIHSTLLVNTNPVLGLGSAPQAGGG